MSYQVLARKWRPKTFADMVGQTAVVRALGNALDQDRLHHAYLFTGTRGVGKTTLVEMLQDRWGWQVVGEPYQENPFLPHFYSDMRRWAFHSQMYFLGARLHQTAELSQTSDSLIQDRCLYEDAVFARNLAESGHLSKEEFATYELIFETCVQQFPAPDLVVYLQATVPTLLQRIQKRGRDFEKNLSTTYLTDLNRIYDRWAQGFQRCPIVTCNVDQKDFVASKEDAATVIKTVEQAVANSES